MNFCQKKGILLQSYLIKNIRFLIVIKKKVKKAKWFLVIETERIQNAAKRVV